MENQTKNQNSKEEPVAYIVHEGIMARMERIIKRLWIALLVAIVLLVASNIGWLVYESQFEDQTTVTQDVDTKESPAYVSGTGAVSVNGKSTSDDNEAARP